MIFSFKKWFPDKWKFHSVRDVQKSTAMGYMALAVIRRGETEERLFRTFFRHRPTDKEIKRHAKAECRKLNKNGERDAFYLVANGERLIEIHESWKDSVTFEVNTVKNLKEGVCLLPYKEMAF